MSCSLTLNRVCTFGLRGVAIRLCFPHAEHSGRTPGSPEPGSDVSGTLRVLRACGRPRFAYTSCLPSCFLESVSRLMGFVLMYDQLTKHFGVPPSYSCGSRRGCRFDALGDGRWVVWLHPAHPAGGGEQVAPTGRARGVRSIWGAGGAQGHSSGGDSPPWAWPPLGAFHSWARGTGSSSEQATRGEESVGDGVAFHGGASSSVGPASCRLLSEWELTAMGLQWLGFWAAS